MENIKRLHKNTAWIIAEYLGGMSAIDTAFNATLSASRKVELLRLKFNTTIDVLRACPLTLEALHADLRKHRHADGQADAWWEPIASDFAEATQ
jgi:hypothetical protein